MVVLIRDRGCRTFGLGFFNHRDVADNHKVVKAQHSTQGRGGAIIQVELHDVDSGNKGNERFHTDETVEKIFVEAKSYIYLYIDEETDTIVLMSVG
ncbi:putative ribosomal protein L2, domain 2 [Helianthus annuus]|nr:putative ribosomal protein L2, domain 2 [Helianthus annuus]